MKTKLVLLALVAIAPIGAMAQFDNGASVAKPAWESFKLPKKTLKLDFRNANVDMVLSLFTKASGITIVKDPNLVQPLTLTSAKAVPLKDAFEILNATLSVRNFELKKEGSLLVIRPKQQNRGGGLTMPPNMDLSALTGGKSELKVYQIQFANASKVAQVLNDVFAQAAANPFAAFGAAAAGAFQRPGRGGAGGGLNFGGGGAQGANLKASFDDYSNTVIVNAPSAQQKQVEELIKSIDKETDKPTKAHVYKLQFASATDLQAVVQGVLQANQTTGRGGQNQNQQNNGGFGFFGFGGGGNNRQNQGAVVADTRSNALVVTATEDNHKIIEQVVKDLDTEIKLATTTFVFPLDNARADQIASLLQSAFGTRSGTGRTNTNNTNNTNRPNNNTNNNNNNRTNNTLGGLNQNETELQLALQDPTLDAGQLETVVAAQGFGFFGGGQGQNNNNRNQNSAQATGRDANGRLVPVQDLTNQVTVIPDQNTNSLIVVTTPEYAEVIRRILGQLDKIPEQVMIETVIVEASLDAESKFGVEWKFAQEKAFGDKGVTGTVQSDLGVASSSIGGFKYTLAGGNLTAFMNAINTDTKFNVLSTPRIFTSNNLQGVINISQRVPYVTSTRTDANGNLTYTYDYQDVGIVLTVTPRITAGGYVTMDVSQTANDLQGFTDFNAPIINQRTATTTVAVKDGETIILGGIIRSTVSTTTKKIPLLGDIPILGNLFKSTDRKNNKTELMVFLTPRVVRNPEDAVKVTEDNKKKLSKPSLDQLNKATGNDVKTEKTTKGGGN